jgi:hypothetical protein
MTQRAITLRFIVPEALAVASGILVLIGIILFAQKHFVTAAQVDANHSVAVSRGSFEPPNPNEQLWRVHLLMRKP